MPQIFDRSSNALGRASLILSGLIVVTLALTMNELQRSPWVTRQGQRAAQPVPFSHKHHIQGLGLQCQYCHTSVEKSSYAGIPPTKTCINCHSQIWTNASLLEPVRQSWATGESIQWTKVHDLPDYVYFNHSIHVNKGLGCSSCHGRVDEMPIMYAENTLQMEWCLNCHRNPSKNLRPISQIYNMAWKAPTEGAPVWCGVTSQQVGVKSAQQVNCVTKEPSGEPSNGGVTIAELQIPNHMPNPLGSPNNSGGTDADAGGSQMKLPSASYKKFTNQADLGHFLESEYHIRTPYELSSCETCHR